MAANCASDTNFAVGRLPPSRARAEVAAARRPACTAAVSCSRFRLISRPPAVQVVIAKFHYTDQTVPDRIRTDPHKLFCGPGLRETPLGPCGSPTKSVRVRAGPRGSGRARVVEFSLSPPDRRASRQRRDGDRGARRRRYL